MEENKKSESNDEVKEGEKESAGGQCKKGRISKSDLIGNIIMSAFFILMLFEFEDRNYSKWIERPFVLIAVISILVIISLVYNLKNYATKTDEELLKKIKPSFVIILHLSAGLAWFYTRIDNKIEMIKYCYETTNDKTHLHENLKRSCGKIIEEHGKVAKKIELNVSKPAP